MNAESHPPPTDAGTASDFSWRRQKAGEVVILHRGKVAATLRGARASTFVAEVEAAAPADAQALMARLTGNYRRGNERTATLHPRNRW